MKTMFIKAILSILAILSPIEEAIVCIGVLIFIDLILGILAAYKLNKDITSTRLKNTAVKLLVYNLLLIASFISEKYLVSWLPFTKICLSFLAIVEITSIGENFQKITGLSFIKYLTEQLDKHLNKGK